MHWFLILRRILSFKIKAHCLWKSSQLLKLASHNFLKREKK